MALTIAEIEELKRIKSERSGRKIEILPPASSMPAPLHAKEAKRATVSKQSPGIVINRMYVGEYLVSNLGHEIINLFQADNGHHYLYLNSSGSFARGHEDVDYMLMVRYVGRNCFEVVAMAKGLEFAPGANSSRPRDIRELKSEISGEQRRYIMCQPGGGVNYGGVSILDIFSDAEQQSVFITYKASRLFLPRGKMRIFLKYDKDAQNTFKINETTISIKEHNLPKTSLKSYIYPSDGFRNSDYRNLIENLINNDTIWDSGRDLKVNMSKTNRQKEITLFDICRINDDENRFSNAIAFFMSQPEYRGLWIEFFKTLGIALEEKYVVEREVNSKIENAEEEVAFGVSGGRIDLLISDNRNLIVIENKIKSDINTNLQDKKNDSTQLNRYVNYINWRLSKDNANVKREGRFFILCPDYNLPDLKDNERSYVIITYSCLYSYLKDKKQVNSDDNFRALCNAMFRHTLPTANGYLYNEMLEKFERRINELRILKHK